MTVSSKVDPLTERALEWLVRLHSGEETEADWNAWHEWRGESEENEAAACRAERVWQQVGPALKPGRAGRMAAGAVVVLLSASVAGALLEPFGPMGGWFADEATGRGQIRQATLPDGSRIMLDTATSFDIRYSPEQRKLELRGGQVFVEVAPDAARPFVIETGGGAVTALGTAFNVRSDETGVSVAVTEHAVRVAYGASLPVNVSEGEATSFAPGSAPLRPWVVDAESVAAWRHGTVVFENLPLGAVLDEIARYRRGTVVFTDSSLKDLPVTGVFNTNAASAFFDALEVTLPVRVTELPLVTIVQPR